MAEAQLHDGLVQRQALVVAQGLLNRLVGHLLHPSPCGGGVVAFVGTPAQVAQHGAGLHRRELVLVAQQHQPGLRRQGRNDRRHHLQIDHRGLVDHQHVHRQGVAHVVAEVPCVGPAAEQPVHGGHLGGDGHAQRLGVRKPVQR